MKNNLETEIRENELCVDTNMLKKKTNAIFNIIKNNREWIIWIIAFVGVVGSFVQKLLEYIRWLINSKVYGTSIELYKFNEVTFISDIGTSLIYMTLFIAIGICINNLANNFLNKEKIRDSKDMRLNLKRISYFSIFIAVILMINSNEDIFFIFRFIFYYLILKISIVFISYLISKIFVEEVVDESAFCGKISIDQVIRIVENNILKTILIIMMFFMVFIFHTYTQLVTKTNYHIIDNNKVIVYATDAYYVVLDCEIKNKNITIHKGKQMKIDNKDVYSVSEKFVKVYFE